MLPPTKLPTRLLATDSAGGQSGSLIFHLAHANLCVPRTSAFAHTAWHTPAHCHGGAARLPSLPAALRAMATWRLARLWQTREYLSFPEPYRYRHWRGYRYYPPPPTNTPPLNGFALINLLVEQLWTTPGDGGTRRWLGGVMGGSGRQDALYILGRADTACDIVRRAWRSRLRALCLRGNARSPSRC